jgi:hypothetical protein
MLTDRETVALTASSTRRCDNKTVWARLNAFGQTRDADLVVRGLRFTVMAQCDVACFGVGSQLGRCGQSCSVAE